MARTTLALTLLSTALLYEPTSAQHPSCGRRANATHALLQECVTVDGVREHQAALQDIADDNGGTRAAGTPGYGASRDYVVERMTAAGYLVTQHAFAHSYVAPASLRQLTPIAADYETGSYTGSGGGEVSATVTAVDINLVPPRATTSGCEAADFAGFPAGNIALIQRGTCTFADKAANAEAAGAAAVIIFNQGNEPAREGLIVGTLGEFVASIPVVGASFANGESLSMPGSTAYVKAFAPAIITQHNVIAESQGGNPDNVVMAGAHLDSVVAGPGINDNGSGAAVLLEVAEQMARVRPHNKVRFAWWGAEEAGLIGSIAYVNDLAEPEREKIALYLNFDVVGSPNYGLFIFDGDDSDETGSGPGPDGSAQIEALFEQFYTDRGQSTKGTDLDGNSDYRPFMEAGIPVGGVFTGAGGVKTAEEQAMWGGTAGEQYDPCFHIACDTFDNNSNAALDLNAHAAAYAILQYSMSTFDINQRRGRGRVPPQTPPVH
jgi:Zn-dependent M28 family amino/carboxypeptidase